MHYPIEELGYDYDDGTMPGRIQELSQAVVGHRIVKVEKDIPADTPWYSTKATHITLDNGTQVQLIDNGDCCAYTEMEAFLLHADRVDHIITGVGTTDEYNTWHIYADMGDVLELTVGWSAGNAGYYAYGFDLKVVPIED